jgi:uncharacterized protein (DUF488 family)
VIEQAKGMSHPILTVGHSTRTTNEFIELLLEHEIKRLVDVRTIPRSRYNPQFNRDELAKSLGRALIGYTHMPELGGLRHARKDSTNTGWRNLSFRGFADYMQTAEFEQGLQRLIEMSAQEPIAIMCAEAVPWRCHRSLIADALVTRGIPAVDIISAGHAQPHKMTPFAHVEDGRVTYPGEEALSLWGGSDFALQDPDPGDKLDRRRRDVAARAGRHPR